MKYSQFTSHFSIKAIYIFGFTFLAQLALSPALKANNITDNTAKIDSLFSKWNHTNTPGASVVVIQDGKIIHKAGYGMAHLEYGIPNTPDTVFHVASVSKQFTAFAIAMLEDQGKLNINDEVHDYITEVPNFNWPITLKQMLHHTSGLRDVIGLFSLQGRNTSDVSTNDHIMRLITLQRDLNFEPDTRFMYSNAGYTLLSKVVSKVSGKSFRQWTSDEIFTPLKMTHSHFNDDYTEIITNRAYSYKPRNEKEGKGAYAKFPMNFSMVGSTGLLTTASDIAKWMNNLISGTYGGVGLQDQMKKSPQLKGGAHIDYGYGLSISPYKGFPSVSHGGIDAGFHSSLLVFPEQKLGIAILSNTNDMPAVPLAQKIADLFLPEQVSPAIPKDITADKEAASVKVAPNKTAIDIAISANQYTGRYMMEDGSFLHITERKAGINLQVGPNALKLYPSSKNDFFITEADAGVSFDLFKDGIYQQASLHNAGVTTNGKKLSSDITSPESLSEYTGRYYIPEVERFIDITVKGEGLTTWNAGVEGIGVILVSKDHFINPQMGASLKFKRNKNEVITEARASLGRIQNMLFEKVIP